MKWINVYSVDATHPIRINIESISAFYPNAMKEERTDIDFIGGKRITVADNYATVRGKIDRADQGVETR